MKCQGKEIQPEDKVDCPNDAIGMFKTVKGNFPLCPAHSIWGKTNRVIIKRRDNYYGDL